VERDDLLDRLAGTWDLRGEMGALPLHQRVEAAWTLRGRFLEMRCVELEGAPYEAVYLVGRGESGPYVLILADSTGVYAEPESIVGLGDRDGDAVEFAFGPAGRPHFLNRFEWADEGWTHRLESVGAGGERTPFALKRLTRVAV
jgi:hypothetical protein